MSSPLAGANYTAPATISLAANVSAKGHSISKVQFYSGAALLSEDTSAPYSFTWSSVGAGTYSLTARAVYDSGSSIASSPASISVGSLPVPWQSFDVGHPAASGSVNFANGNYTINGAGLLNGSADSCYFLYQYLQGDGGITVRLNSMANTGTDSRAGIMIRESLGTGSEYVFIGLSPNGQFIWQHRTSTGALSTSGVSSVATSPNAWVRLVRAGNSFDGYASPDGGVSWAHIYTCTFTMASSTYVGLVVASGSSTTLNNSTFSSLTLGSPLPAPWQWFDIGHSTAVGGANVASGTYTISGAGTLSGSSDSFNFAYQYMNGDGSITARLNSMANTGTNARAGVMIRESSGGGSEYVFIGLSPNGQFIWQNRTSTGALTTSGVASVASLPNSWVRLVRAGNKFDGYSSTDGATWAHIYTCTFTMASSTYVGLVVASGSDTSINTSTFSSVTVVP